MTSPVPVSAGGVRVFFSEEENDLRVAFWNDAGATVNVSTRIPLGVLLALAAVRFGDVPKEPG